MLSLSHYSSFSSPSSLQTSSSSSHSCHSTPFSMHLPLSSKAPFWKKIVPKRHDTSRRRSSSGKSVRFSDSCTSVYYTYGAGDYDRSGSMDLDAHNNNVCHDNLGMAEQLHGVEDDEIYVLTDMNDLTDEDRALDEQVRRNTKINMKRQPHSVAALIQYRANF
ncbi:hypothetical protein BC940DRAFT_44118 [Gongronella butleri]|nr:hypothetical protein BC940DRAFT_44118 [Gongronella butleri]